MTRANLFTFLKSANKVFLEVNLNASSKNFNNPTKISSIKFTLLVSGLQISVDFTYETIESRKCTRKTVVDNIGPRSTLSLLHV